MSYSVIDVNLHVLSLSLTIIFRVAYVFVTHNC